MNRRLVVVALGVLGLLASGCYSTPLGDSFKKVGEDPRRTVVYVYRPRDIVGWARPVHVSVGGTERIVMVGGYAVFPVKPGKHKIFAYGTDGSQTYFTHDMGASTNTSIPTTIEAKAGSSVYLRIRSSIAALELSEVSTSEGADQASSCDLTPGGAFR